MGTYIRLFFLALRYIELVSISFDARMRTSSGYARRRIQLSERNVKAKKVPPYFVTILPATIKVALEGNDDPTTEYSTALKSVRGFTNSGLGALSYSLQLRLWTMMLDTPFGEAGGEMSREIGLIVRRGIVSG